MKIKLLIIILFLPIFISAQNSGSPEYISLEYKYDKGNLNIAVKNTSNGDVLIQNERELMDGRSAIDVKFLDGNGKTIYNGRWGVGTKSNIIISKYKSINVNYPIDQINTNQGVIKKIIMDIYIKYTVIVGNNRKVYFYKETKEILIN